MLFFSIIDQFLTQFLPSWLYNSLLSQHTLTSLKTSQLLQIPRLQAEHSLILNMYFFIHTDLLYFQILWTRTLYEWRNFIWTRATGVMGKPWWKRPELETIRACSDDPPCHTLTAKCCWTVAITRPLVPVQTHWGSAVDTSPLLFCNIILFLILNRWITDNETVNMWNRRVK